MKKRPCQKNHSDQERSRCSLNRDGEYQKRKAKEFGKLLREGAFDYPATNDEVERGQG